ncbi:MAG: formylglycine-generating enzyme family protein [Planctomycetaceae bacterium]|nr:formylglycine-generating enzyme family protein [Planctomycetaceae bacterium]
MPVRKSLIAFAVSLSFTVLALCSNIGYIQADDNPKAGDPLELTVKNVKYRFRWCPAGTFTMGSPLSEADRNNNEQLHPVTLSQGFYLAETEVTQEQWESIAGNNPSNFKGSKLPVECVDWNACQDFVKELNALGVAPKGYKFSLPTESQWESACRSGSTTAYCFGENSKKLGDYAWYNENSKNTTHEVGTKKPNAWNLYDMHGNVFEWCNDWYGNYPSATASTAELTDPIGASSGSYRVRRGGSWLLSAEDCRSAFRSLNSPDYAGDFIGVRVALVSGE